MIECLTGVTLLLCFYVVYQLWRGTRARALVALFATFAGRLDLLTDCLDDALLARLAALGDELPAPLSADGTTPERIAAAAQLRRARAFLEAL